MGGANQRRRVVSPAGGASDCVGYGETRWELPKYYVTSPSRLEGRLPPPTTPLRLIQPWRSTWGILHCEVKLAGYAFVSIPSKIEMLRFEFAAARFVIVLTSTSERG